MPEQTNRRMQSWLILAVGIWLFGCAATPEVATTSPPPVPLRRACAGTHLDLAWINATRSCRTDIGPPVDSAVVASLQPEKITVASGEAGEVALVLSNPTDKPMIVDLGLYCDISALSWMITYTDGKRADLITRCGGGGGGCGSGTTRLRLAPRGDARIYLPVIAIVKKADDKCKPTGSSPMVPGSYIYELEAGSFSDKPLRAQLTVTAAKR